MAEIKAPLIEAMRRALIDFGYSPEHMTTEYIKSEAERLQKEGETPLGGPSFFIYRWLQKAKVVK